MVTYSLPPKPDLPRANLEWRPKAVGFANSIIAYPLDHYAKSMEPLMKIPINNSTSPRKMEAKRCKY
jgi:hypothetical protein